jgi:SAM-dependent methyltransferase
MSRVPKERFSDRVDDYVRYRPQYPGELIATLRKEIALEPSWVIADVGSGTGISSEPFLKHGNVVFGVEPNREMRRAAGQLLARYAGFKNQEGSAEATGLPDRSVDLVIAGQAFHWFDPARTRAEFRRILRSDGWIVLFWNSRRTDASPFLREYEELLLRHGTDYRQVRHERVTAGLTEEFFQGNCRRLALANEQRLDYEGLKGRLLSSSYTPANGDPTRERMLEDLDRLFRRHAESGRVTMLYETELWIGKPGREPR